MIIGITGLKRSGKDTIADYIKDKYNYKKMALADSLKKACQEIFLFDDDQLWGDKKDLIDARYNTTPRKILQVVGSELFQFDIYNYIPEISKAVPLRMLWVNRVLLEIYKMQNKAPIHSTEKMYQGYFGEDKELDIVISDVRFPHEALAIQKFNGIVIKVIRNGLKVDDHISEKSVDDIQCEYTIINDGTIKDLYNKVNHVLWLVKNDRKRIKLER